MDQRDVTYRRHARYESQSRSCDRPNVLTLSCKNRLTCLPREAARRLPRPTRSGTSELAADVPRACSSSRPRRLGRRASGPAGFVSLCGQLGRIPKKIAASPCKNNLRRQDKYCGLRRTTTGRSKPTDDRALAARRRRFLRVEAESVLPAPLYLATPERGDVNICHVRQEVTENSYRISRRMRDGHDVGTRQSARSLLGRKFLSGPAVPSGPIRALWTDFTFRIIDTFFVRAADDARTHGNGLHRVQLNEL